MTDSQQTIGDFRFGLSSAEAHAEFTGSLYRELTNLKELGDVPSGTSYYDIADVILDTISNYATIAEIPATELPTLIYDALIQLEEE